MQRSEGYAILASVLLMLAPISSARASHGSVTVHVPGYTYCPFVTTSVFGVADLELDPAGNLYLCESGNIQRVTPEAAISPWSTATASDIVFTSTGAAYGAGRAHCHCIVSISSSGAHSPLHSDAFEWTYVTLGIDGTLYASVWAGSGQGLYAIDRVTGTPTVLVNGGPELGGSGIYSNMVVGVDGKLYTGGGGGTGGWAVFRLDGTQFTAVGTAPHSGGALAQDNEGILYVAGGFEGPTGSFFHEVWMIDLGTGLSTLLASGPHLTTGIAYDRARDRLYVGLSYGEVYIITKTGAVPTRRATWGEVKQQFR